MINYILINIFLILAIIYILYKSRHAYHMLQLESYKNKRYLKWMKNNNILLKKDLFTIIPMLSLFFNIRLGLVINIIWVLLLLLFRNKYIEKKPLVITNRIKRMYCTEILVLLIILILANIYIKLLIIVDILIICTYIYILIINIINFPIEKLIQLKFYKQAERKLKENSNLKVIGITGSYGKTSTKYILGTILSQKYNTLITQGSYNTTMGVVRTINENLTNTHQVFVCEMGAKCIGDIKEICDLVKPTYGVLTAIGPQHLETFKTIENVKKTKLELIKSLPQDGLSFVNNEDENISKIEFNNNNIKFGINNKCDYYAENIEMNEFGASFDVNIKNSKKMHVKTKLLGRHNIINIVGAVAVCNELGLSEEEIIRGIRFLKPVAHRLELKRNANGSIIIDDAYNSNVKGAKAALEVLNNFKGMKKVLITPGIVDLGDKSEIYNKEFGKQAARNSDYIILVGEKQSKPILEGIREENYNEKNVYIAKNLTSAINKMNEIINENTVVLFENDLPDNYL
ncbi:MAG: UDP-N-acetylmuramoyl-tripeptide--D-alanyl-D-alanine ligase [Clostridia bacterium]